VHWLSVMAQAELPCRIRYVRSNDAVYGGASELHEAIATCLERVMRDLHAIIVRSDCPGQLPLDLLTHVVQFSEPGEDDQVSCSLPQSSPALHLSLSRFAPRYGIAVGNWPTRNRVARFCYRMWNEPVVEMRDGDPCELLSSRRNEPFSQAVLVHSRCDNGIIIHSHLFISCSIDIM
jgi:hypothetical protein